MTSSIIGTHSIKFISAKTANATDEKKKPKKVKISIPLNKTEDRMDYVEHSSETTEKSKEKYVVDFLMVKC